MKIRELMSAEVVSVQSDCSLLDAARTLWKKDCGSLAVVDRDGALIGMLTDRDICMGAMTRGGTLASLNVAQSMAAPIQTLDPEADIEDALEKMRSHQVRRMPVLDDESKLVGMLSMADLINHSRSLRLKKDRTQMGERVLDCLTAIQHPHDTQHGVGRGILRPVARGNSAGVVARKTGRAKQAIPAPAPGTETTIISTETEGNRIGSAPGRDPVASVSEAKEAVRKAYKAKSEGQHKPAATDGPRMATPGGSAGTRAPRSKPK